MSKNHLVSGSWNAICDRCGFKRKSHQMQKEWTGLIVCSSCFEPRHPQDFTKGRKDRQAPPWVRPEPADVFRTVDVTEDDL